MTGQRNCCEPRGPFKSAQLSVTKQLLKIVEYKGGRLAKIAASQSIWDPTKLDV